MSYSNKLPKPETPVKLSDSQYKEWHEDSMRFEAEKHIVDTKLKNQALNRDGWFKAYQLASGFSNIVNSKDEMNEIAELIYNRLKTEEIEFKRPAKSLNLV